MTLPLEVYVKFYKSGQLDKIEKYCKYNQKYFNCII